MVEAMARAGGRKTGLFTSPHLTRFSERICINGEPLEDEVLRHLLDDALARGPRLSFFETATLASFLAFRDAKVDVAVIEVGLGGRLDATNVLEAPRAAAITRIALDHTDRLGKTFVEVAREKAGIAKPGLTLTLGPMTADVRAAIDAIAKGVGATTTSADDDEDAMHCVASAELGLPGVHQRANARVAYVLGRQLGIDARAREEGIEKVHWPGRLETIVTPDGPVLIDAAHNPDGVGSLVDHLESLNIPSDRIAIVFGVLADKAWCEMLDRIAGTIGRRVYVAPRGRAAIAPEALAARHAGQVAASVDEGVARARAAVGPRGLVVIAGSILLIGEARANLLGLRRDLPVGL
jgi:dihydrofolate synthase/folylpolyglutamate synthase